MATARNPISRGIFIVADVRVVKVKYQGQTLVLREDEKDMLWDYFEDWSYTGVELEFTTMPKAEADALPEFAGF